MAGAFRLAVCLSVVALLLISVEGAVPSEDHADDAWMGENLATIMREVQQVQQLDAKLAPVNGAAHNSASSAALKHAPTKPAAAPVKASLPSNTPEEVTETSRSFTYKHPGIYGVEAAVIASAQLRDAQRFMHEIEEQEKQSSVVSPPAHATQPTRAGTPKSAAETTPAATVKVSTVSPLPPAGGTVAPPKSTPEANKSAARAHQHTSAKSKSVMKNLRGSIRTALAPANVPNGKPPGSAKPSITPESRSSKPPASATARVQKRNESNTGSVDPSRTAAHQLKRQPELSEEEARVAVESSASQLSRDAELAALRQLQAAKEQLDIVQHDQQETALLLKPKPVANYAAAEAKSAKTVPAGIQMPSPAAAPSQPQPAIKLEPRASSNVESSEEGHPLSSLTQELADLVLRDRSVANDADNDLLVQEGLRLYRQESSAPASSVEAPHRSDEASKPSRVIADDASTHRAVSALSLADE